MKRNATKAERQNYIAYAFEHLTPDNQNYLETLTAQLSKNQKIAPETQNPTGKKQNSVVKHKEEQENK